MKKLTAIILSAALAAAQTSGIAANAETGVDYYAGKTVDEVYTELSGEDFVFLSDLYRYGGGCTLTLDSSGKFHIIEKNSRGTEITVAKGSELPVDEIISAAREQIKESPEKQKPIIKKNPNGYAVVRRRVVFKRADFDVRMRLKPQVNLLWRNEVIEVPLLGFLLNFFFIIPIKINALKHFYPPQTCS